jgi:transposase
VRLKFSKLGHYQSNRLLDQLVAGMPARTAADLVGVNRRSAILFYHQLRTIIAWHIEQEWAFSGEIETDEPCFGGRRKDRRGRGAAGKIPVFGILQRGEKVYTKVIPDAKAQPLLPIIRNLVVPDSMSILTIFAPTMPSMSQSSNIFASTIGKLLSNTRITSMASRISGIRPNGIYGNITVFPNPIFGSF